MFRIKKKNLDTKEMKGLAYLHVERLAANCILG